MVKHRFESEQWVAKPLDAVFAFFRRPENVATITPPWLDFILLSAAPAVMEGGQRIEYSIRPFGVRVRGASVITDYAPPHRFTDEQVRGPLKSWRHTHEFSERKGGVLMKDSVEYELPFGIFGVLAHALYVRWVVKSIFKHRARVLQEVLG